MRFFAKAALSASVEAIVIERPDATLDALRGFLGRRTARDGDRGFPVG